MLSAGSFRSPGDLPHRLVEALGTDEEEKSPRAMINTFVILGASGDLTARFLVPALACLHGAGQLPEDFRVIGLARDPWNTETFRQHVGEKMARAAPGTAPALRDAILSISEYHPVDVMNRSQVGKSLGAVKEPLVVYLALPPALFKPTIETLTTLELPRGSKIVLEKPFGENLASAQDLNRLLHESFPERDVFRLDHFLGKQTVQNILGSPLCQPGLRTALEFSAYRTRRHHLG